MPIMADLQQATNHLDEASLVAAAKLDVHAFAPLYRTYAPRIYAYCLHRMGSREAAEDATSRTFERAIQHLASCQDDAFRGWLFTVAMHVVDDHYRGQRRPTSLVPLEWADEIESREPSIEEFVMANDAADRLYQQLQFLPVDQRRVLELRAAGLRGTEIASLLGRSHASVRMLQFRAIRHLRHVMERDVPQGQIQ